jgi:uncharacterized iron-regulated membrane protein
MRALFVRLHRWFGLFMAVFLFISGLTGAVISWDHELDEWLNPKLFKANSGEVAADLRQAPLELARQLEQREPGLQVSFLPLSIEPGHALGVGVDPRPDPVTGKISELGFNQVALDPVTGEVQGRREWGAISLTRENLMPFLYKLHYSMHIPDGFGIEIGIWFMGIVGIVWAIDCFIALWISFPNAAAWRKSFAFRWKQGGYKLNFDLHRSGSMWVWALLLLLAVTSISMNLGTEIMRPLVNSISPLTPSVFDERTPTPIDEAIVPVYTREQILETARAEAVQRGWTAPAGSIFYSDHFGVYGVGFFEPGQDHGDGGLGNPWLYFDSTTGKLASVSVPGAGSAGDLFMDLQFPLHSGRIIGIPGRIFVSILGLVVSMVCVTGVVIWARKRKARARSSTRALDSLVEASA